VLPAGSLEAPAYLVVTATGDRCQDNTTEPSIALDRPVGVDAVVEDLISAFATSQRGTNSAIGPGVMAIAGDRATPDELASMQARQEMYFRNLITEADRLDAEGNGAHITGTHRLAAKSMGTEDRKWFKEVAHRPMKTCLACDGRIPYGAKKCALCNTDLLAWGKEHGVTREQDEVVWEALNPGKSVVKPPLREKVA
jgi:ribosomal protein L40E